MFVNIGRQFMVFDTVRSEMFFARGVRGAILLIQVVFETAIVIKADGVAVVAGKALAVARASEKPMRGKLPVSEFEVAGGAACAVGDGWVIISLEVEMAAQAAASKEIVGEPDSIFWFGCDRDLGQRLQIGGCTEGVTHAIDEVFQGEMWGMLDIFDLCRVAFATAYGHRLGMCRLADKTEVGKVFFRRIVVALVAGGAGQIMIFVQFHRMTGDATFCDRRRWSLVLLTGRQQDQQDDAEWIE